METINKVEPTPEDEFTEKAFASLLKQRDELLEALEEYVKLNERMIRSGVINAALGSPIRIKAQRLIESISSTGSLIKSTDPKQIER